MKRWIVRLEAVIDDKMEIEAETPEEAEEFAKEDWTFTEAHSWKATAVEEVES